MSVAACVFMRNPVVMSWLGHQRIIDWVLRQLLEVRGLTRIVLCVSHDFPFPMRTSMEDHGILVRKMPGFKEDAMDEDFYCWASGPDGPASDATFFVAVQPTLPFLPAAKIEHCLELVRAHGGASSTVIAVDALLQENGKITKGAVESEVYGCRVLSQHALRKICESPGVRSWAENLRTVPLDRIEALDCSDVNMLTLSQALVQVGAI